MTPLMEPVQPPSSLARSLASSHVVTSLSGKIYILLLHEPFLSSQLLKYLDATHVDVSEINA